ncbi:hypothetical protein, partial [Klebsiella pneumoniae]|uniref:hypothetical protein n=1 Tax=Klebsiella pneumoniae TaxID=573 RepID=UPI0040458A8D
SRFSQEEALQKLDHLCTSKLLQYSIVDGVVVYSAHQWREWQPCSDNAAERMRNARQNKKPNMFRTNSEHIPNKPPISSEHVPNIDR